MSHRIHITGASGSGVTTLGRALAGASGLPHHDTDDYYWLPTEPPYRVKRDVADRLRLMREMFAPRTGWVLSGSLMGWAQEMEPFFDAVVFVSTPTDVRLDRLRQREALRYGVSAASLDGDHYESTKAFLDWAASYDDPQFVGRSRVRHEAWLQTLPCRILRVDGSEPVDKLVGHIRGELPGPHAGA